MCCTSIFTCVISKKQKKARERYRNLSEKEKNKKRNYACEQYRNISDKKREVASI